MLEDQCSSQLGIEFAIEHYTSLHLGRRGLRLLGRPAAPPAVGAEAGRQHDALAHCARDEPRPWLRTILAPARRTWLGRMSVSSVMSACSLASMVTA